MSTTAVFLDRDDTIIRDVPYLNDPDKIELLPGAAQAIALLNEHDLPVIIVTNQSGIARGLLDEHILKSIHERLTALLSEQGASIDAIYYCPHHPEGSVAELRRECACRKPAPGLLLKAAFDFGLDLKRCYLVGDKPIDIQTIHRVGGRGIHLAPAPDSTLAAEHTAADLWEAAQWIVRDLRA